jgi:cytochrome P450
MLTRPAALRLFPPVPLNGRVCIETTTLPHGGGHDGQAPILVPKGTVIGFSTFATHRSSKLYDDANRFRIDRWEGNAVKARIVDWSYHPFLGGQRKCLGGGFGS